MHDAPASAGGYDWPVNREKGAGLHARVSAIGGRPATAPTARLVQAGADDQPQVLIAGGVASPHEARAFASALMRFADQATLAPRGLDLLLTLARGRVTLAEMAQASGLDIQRLREQQAGGQVLSVHDIDQLALAVAHLVTARDGRANSSRHVGREDS